MEDPICFVVLIETASNQATIFQTNKLKENIGASQLIYQVGTQFLFDAIGKTRNWQKAHELDAYLLDETKNPSIFDMDGDDGVEIVVAASGKAILLVKTEKRARQIIGNVTKQVLRMAPGVNARCNFVAVNEKSAKALHEAIRLVHGKVARLGARLPSAHLRYQRLPFVAECASSGYPAAEISKGDGAAVSAIVAAKRALRDDGWGRIETSLEGVAFEQSIDDIERHGLSWVGIVHADGNGLGQVFLNFDELAGTDDAKTYISKLRSFSLAIDACTRAATKSAIEAVWNGGQSDWGRNRAPVIPVVLGGDDLTVICDGTRAVRFAARYLQSFAQETKSCAAITQIVGPGGLAAAAGVAVIKPHFPFHRAYELAEARCASAKAVKEKVVSGAGTDRKTVPCSALDFQVLFDSSGADLERIRARMVGPDGSRLSVRPYVVTTRVQLQKAGASADSLQWVQRRRFAHLLDAVNFIGRKSSDDEGARPALPRRQLHSLLDACYKGRAIAEAQFTRLNQVYDDLTKDFKTLCPLGDGAIYVDDEGDGAAGEPVAATMILDAVELQDLEAQAPKHGQDETEAKERAHAA